MERNPYTPPGARLDPALADGASTAGLSKNARFYSVRQLFTACLIGSPLAAAWLASANFRALSKLEESRKMFLWSIVVTITSFGIAGTLPARAPNFILPVITSVIVRFVAEKRFQAIEREHYASGGAKGSWWSVIGTAVLVGVGVLAVLVLLSLGLEQLGIGL